MFSSKAGQIDSAVNTETNYDSAPGLVRNVT